MSITINRAGGVGLPLQNRSAGGFESASGSQVVSPEPQRLILTGTGFGAGPTVLLYEDGSNVLEGSRIGGSSPRIGTWMGSPTSKPAPRKRTFKNLPAFEAVDNEADTSQLTNIGTNFGQQFKEFFVCGSLAVPAGRTWPNATAPEQIAQDSSVKSIWVTGGQYASGPADLGSDYIQAIGVSGYLSSGGNQRKPIYCWTANPFEWDDWNTYQSWHKPDPSDDVGLNGIHDAIETTVSGGTTREREAFQAFLDTNDNLRPASERYFDRLTFVGYTDTGQDADNSDQLLYGPVYFAAGDNAAARIVLTNNADMFQATRAAVIPHDYWSDTRIEVTIPDWAPGYGLTHWVRFDNNGQVAESGLLPLALIEGQELTLNIAAIETIANPAPSGYDNFNEYPDIGNGDLVPIGGTYGEANARWTGYSIYGARYQLDANDPYGNRAYSAYCPHRRGDLVGLKPNVTGPARSLQTVYTTHLVKLNEALSKPPQDYNGGSVPPSLKFIRIWDESANGYGTRLSFTYKHSFHVAHGMGTATQADNVNLIQDYGDRSMFDDEPNTWVRIEAWLDGVSGKAQGRINGKLVHDLNNFSKSPGVDNEDFSLRLVGIDPSSQDMLNTTLHHRLAEIYEQPTQARLELSNSGVWDDTGYQRMVYQRTIERGARLKFELFLGDLDPQQPIYLYEVSSDGTVTSHGRIN